jgi:hypothetical protein
VKWTDEWDPATNHWAKLSDAGYARDHFMSVAFNGKIYRGGGRRSSGKDTNNIFLDVEANIDVFDVTTKTWSVMPHPIPTARAAPQTGLIGQELIYVGGEGPGANVKGVWNHCEAVNLATGEWHTYNPSPKPRHATQGIVNNGGLYTVAGSPNGGGLNINDLDGPIQVVFYPGGAETFPKSEALTRGVIDTSEYAAARAVGQDKISVPIALQSGEQGLLITKVSLTNFPGAKIADSITYPILLLPRKSIPVTITLATGTPPAAGTITVDTSTPAKGIFSRRFTISTSASMVRAPKKYQTAAKARFASPASRNHQFGGNGRRFDPHQ